MVWHAHCHTIRPLAVGPEIRCEERQQFAGGRRVSPPGRDQKPGALKFAAGIELETFQETVRIVSGPYEVNKTFARIVR